MSVSAAQVLADRAPVAIRVGVILGSGLGAVAETVRGPVVVPYGELPGFPAPGVAGHAGRVVLGEVSGVGVAMLQGRAHPYEGGDPEALRAPVRALRGAGAEIVVLTNAAGSIRPEVGPGSLMAITDHINLSGTNILIGRNDDALGPRFPSMRDAYDPALLRVLRVTADELDIPLSQGVYLAVSGPSLETPAEIRAFASLGADAVGMSTAHETIVARHCGLRVAAISVISNLAEGVGDAPIEHDRVLRHAAQAARSLAALLTGFLARLPG